MHIVKRILPLAFAAVSFLTPQAQDNTAKGNNVLDLKHSITDNAVVFPESFEADTQKLLESWFIKNYTATDNRYATQPDADVTDAEMVKRHKALPTVIEMPYNQIVRQYIDRYTKKGRAQVAALLGLGIYYMPIFEQALEEQGLPVELKYLPVIESGLDPNAVSKHGAAGLWQFMLGTAKGLGLEVNSVIDERRDPYLSSEKAASYLKDLYATYGDWSLAIAAYNCGPGTVNKAIRRAGGDPKSHDFWSIYNFLTPEARGYVPSFIAANYVMTYYPKHNISPVLPTKPLVTDTIQIQERIHFNQISKVLDIPVDELRILNPQFRADIIPGTPDNPCTLILPSQQIHAFILSEKAIRETDAEKYALRGTAEPGDTPAYTAAETSNADPEDAGENDVALAASQGKATILIHKVAAGETLASIADKYNISPAQIKTQNNLRRNAVRVGQQLRIATEQATAQQTATQLAPASEKPKPQASAQTKQPAAKKTSTTSHTIKKGETLSLLSKKYGVTIAEIKKANGMSNDNLRAGQTIKIPAKSTAKSSGTKKKSSSSKKRRR